MRPYGRRGIRTGPSPAVVRRIVGRQPGACIRPGIGTGSNFLSKPPQKNRWPDLVGASRPARSTRHIPAGFRTDVREHEVVEIDVVLDPAAREVLPLRS